MEDIFRFGGGLCLRLFYGIQLHKLSTTYSSVFMRSALPTFGKRAKAWGHLSMAACITLIV